MPVFLFFCKASCKHFNSPFVIFSRGFFSIRHLLALLSCCTPLLSVAQTTTFSSLGGSIPGSATTQTCFPLTVSGIGTIGGTIGLSQVCMTINHPVADELEILLQAPDGTYVPLSIQNGNGANYTSTCFTATATTPIKFGASPYTGSFLPEGHLGAVNNGQNANGIWRLCILDRRNAGNAGNLVNWALTFSNSPAPQPPTLPACTSTIPATSDCANAVSICDFNGACGSTVSTPVQSWPALSTASCFGLNNNTFVKFVAAAPTVSFSVWVPVSANGFNNINGGIQMLFFGGNCGGAVTTYGCYNRIYPYSPSGQPVISVVYASGLTPGNTYFLMIDGANGDLCNFTLAANSGVNILNIQPPAPSVCQGSSVTLTASGGNGVYSWSPAAGLSATSGATVTATPTAAGTTTYTVTSSTVLGCPASKNVTITVNPLPATPAASVTAQPSCSTPTGTITISAPVGTGLEYSINGTTYQTGTSFSGLAPGGYNVTVRNTATGCVSAPTALTVNAVPAAPPTPTASVTSQPTCSTPTGTITISAPVGTGLEYSINGSAYQTGTSFSGLAPGGYNITVRNTATGCVSVPTSLTVNAVPAAPPAPAASATAQPSCFTPTGTITVSAPLGANLEYSINGTTWQAGTAFSGLAPGNYTVTVRNTSNGCVSATTAVTINAAPAVPSVPAASVTTQPSCSTPTGTITVSAPVGANLEYSINGTTFQTSPVFNNVASGNYTIRVRHTSSGCTVTGNTVTVNAAPVVPPAPTVVVTSPPNCSTSVATITITAPVGPGFEYSLGGAYQASPVFTNTAPGSYNFTVRNSEGCVSSATVITINPPLSFPSAPALTTTQPNCTTSTGSITIVAPLGAALEYSIGGPFQSSTQFSNVVPGTYNVVARDLPTGCISTPAQIIINPVPLPPAAPSIMVTAQPTCPVPTGSISITAPTGSFLEYSAGGPYQAATSFSGLQAGTYSITVRSTQTGCVSAGTNVVINPVPPAPAVPVFTITATPGCSTPDGGILTVTSPVGSTLEYSLNGNFQPSPVFTGLVGGSYTGFVRNTVSGCVSGSTTVALEVPICNDDLFVPNAFSPNNDGRNDRLFVRGTQIQSMQFLVYNQWGEKVFESIRPADGWDGTVGGKPQPVGVYMYVLKATLGNGTTVTKKGSVTLIR